MPKYIVNLNKEKFSKFEKIKTLLNEIVKYVNMEILILIFLFT